MSGGMTLRRNKRGNMHFNVICVSYSDKDDTDMMMGAHTVDDSNPYRSAELDYYTRVPLPLKDGTKEDVTRGGLVPLDGISSGVLDSAMAVITPDGVYHSSDDPLDGDADEIIGGLHKDYGQGKEIYLALYDAHL